MRVLELGSYLAPAYAGLILAEQGFYVEKWSTSDPIQSLLHGDELWEWVNFGKVVKARHASEVAQLTRGDFDVIVDNHRASRWAQWGISVDELAMQLDVTWVSLRSDQGDVSFDLIAQARAWGDSGVLPFYIGDTAAGLWVAFKALASPRGHHVVHQASALAKLKEGELVVPRPSGTTPWDADGTYVWDSSTATATIQFKGHTYHEPARNDHWRRDNLHHRDGRYTV